MSSAMGARVFVRSYDGATQTESEEELVTLPPPPLAWNNLLSILIMAVTKQDAEPVLGQVKRARLFLLPTEEQGVVAELNARALRFGVRDNDQFAVCLNGEEYRRPQDAEAEASEAQPEVEAEAEPSPVPAAMPSLPSVLAPPPILPPLAPPGSQLAMGIRQPPAGIFSHDGMSKRSKRYRSISGKMQAINSLGENGFISAEDRGRLKDLLLNNDSPALQEALDLYQSTGKFQMVKDLLEQETQNPSAKRATGDWLPEGFIHDMSRNFQTSSPESSPHYHAPASLQQAQDGSYASVAAGGGPSPHETSPYSNAYAADTLHNYSAQPINMSWPNASASLHDTLQNTTSLYTSSIDHSMATQRPPSAYTTITQQQSLYRQENDYAASPAPQAQSAAYAGNSTAAYPASSMYPHAAGAYVNAYQTMGGYPTTAAQQAAYAGYASSYMAAQYYGTPQQQYYAYGYGKGVEDDKWSSQTPMPSYPPACSKEEKKEKIARWLKKREHRNWSNKPSYPVRHAIATQRKRGEDGRFITKPKGGDKDKEAKDASKTTSTNDQNEVLPTELLSA